MVATSGSVARRPRTAAPEIDRLTPQDLSMLWPDDLGWPQDIGVIAVLDGTALLDADGQVRIARVREAIERRLHLARRLRQVVYRPRPGLGGPLWVDAPSMDIAEHVRVRELPPGAGDAQLLLACEELHRRRLDRARPLWELWLLPGLPDRRVGMYMKVHHVVADGVAGVALFRGLLDLEPAATEQPPPPWTPQPPPRASRLLADSLRRRGRALSRMAARLAHPNDITRRVRGAWPAYREVFSVEPAPPTSLNQPIGPDRRFAVCRGRLDLARQAGRSVGATVNDVVLAAVAGGLRELLRSRGERVDDLVLRAAVPVSLHGDAAGDAGGNRDGGARGNRDGGMMVPLPVGEPDDGRRLRLIAADTARRKRQRVLRPVQAGIAGAAITQKIVLRLMSRQRIANVYVANVPGPAVRLYLAGAPILEMFPVVPLNGNVTLGVGVLSYAGQLNVAAVGDRDRCPDVPVFLAGLHDAMDELIQAAPSTGAVQEVRR